MIGIDIGKNSFHVVGLDRGAIILRQKWSRSQFGHGYWRQFPFVAERD